jgi:hypothetical protein
MAKTVFDVLKEKIDDQITMYQNHLIDGTCEDFAKYKELCGVIRGLATARREIQDLAKHVEDDDD